MIQFKIVIGILIFLHAHIGNAGDVLQNSAFCAEFATTPSATQDVVPVFNNDSYLAGPALFIFIISGLIIRLRLSKNTSLQKTQKIATAATIILSIGVLTIYLLFAFTQPTLECLNSGNACNTQLWLLYFGAGTLTNALALEGVVDYLPVLCTHSQHSTLIKAHTWFLYVWSLVSTYIGIVVFTGASPFDSDTSAVLASVFSFIDGTVFAAMILGLKTPGCIMALVIFSGYCPFIIVVTAIGVCGGGQKSAGVGFLSSFVFVSVLRSIAHQHVRIKNFPTALTRVFPLFTSSPELRH